MNAETLAAIGEPNRFRIFELLREGPQPVNEIGGRLGLRQSQVSQHLKVLKDLGLVDVAPHAQQRVYGVRPQPLQQMQAWLDRYRDIWADRFEQLDELVEELTQSFPSPSSSKK